MNERKLEMMRTPRKANEDRDTPISLWAANTNEVNVSAPTNFASHPPIAPRRPRCPRNRPRMCEYPTSLADLKY